MPIHMYQLVGIKSWVANGWSSTRLCTPLVPQDLIAHHPLSVNSEFDHNTNILAKRAQLEITHRYITPYKIWREVSIEFWAYTQDQKERICLHHAYIIQQSSPYKKEQEKAYS